MNCVASVTLAVVVTYLAILTACMPDPDLTQPKDEPASSSVDPIDPKGTVQLPPKSPPPEPVLPYWDRDDHEPATLKWALSTSETVLEIYRPCLVFGDFPANSTMVIMVTKEEMDKLIKAYPDRVKNGDSKMPLRFCK